MVNTKLGIIRKCRLVRLLLFAVAIGWTGTAWGAAQPLPQPVAAPQGQGMAAKAVARRATAKPDVATPAPANNEEEMASVPSSSTAGGRRDPFLIPKVRAGGEGLDKGEPLPPGKRGLLIGQLRLQGVVRQSGSKGMIAVVENNTNRAYFLRVNDEVYHGVVSKITPDSIYFTENVRTPDGQTASREVIRRLGSGTGENR